MLQHVVKDAELNVRIVRRLLSPCSNPGSTADIQCERGRNHNQRKLGSKCHHSPFNASGPPKIHAGQWAFPVRPSYDTGGFVSLQDAFPEWLRELAEARLSIVTTYR